MDSDEEKKHHEQCISEQFDQMNASLETIDGSALGCLTDAERHLMESDDFQVRFMPLPDKRRSEGQHEFTVHLSRFPNMYQAALLTLLDRLKDAGLKLTWTRNSLHEWLEDHAVNTLDDMAISLFTALETDAFTFSGDYKQVLSAIKACIDKSGISPEYKSAVPNMLNRVMGGV